MDREASRPDEADDRGAAYGRGRDRECSRGGDEHGQRRGSVLTAPVRPDVGCEDVRDVAAPRVAPVHEPRRD